MKLRTMRILPIVLLIGVGMLLAACTASQPSAGTGGAISGDVPGDTIQPAGGTRPNGTTIEAENKTAIDQHNETLMAVVPDGTYTDNVTYHYHSGVEMVTISLTVKDDVVTAASVLANNPNPVSARYISGVNGALPTLVVGKRIDQLNLPRQISGSSLTAGAFRQYVDGLVKEQ